MKGGRVLAENPAEGIRTPHGAKNKHHTTSSSIEQTSGRQTSAFLRLQKYEPERQRPGRTSGCHRPGRRVNAASWIFHTEQRSIEETSGNTVWCEGAVNTAGGCELVMALTSSMHVLLFLPHFLYHQISKWLLSPPLTVTFDSLHTHKIRSVVSILCFENTSLSFGVKMMNARDELYKLPLGSRKGDKVCLNFPMHGPDLGNSWRLEVRGWDLWHQQQPSCCQTGRGSFQLVNLSLLNHETRK